MDSVSALPASQPATVELQLTKAMSAVLAADSTGKRRLLFVIAGAIAAFLLLLGAVLEMLLLLGGIALAIALILVGAALWQGQTVRKDLSAAHFLRTSGPLAVVEGSVGSAGDEDGDGESTSTYRLKLADRSFFVASGVGRKIPGSLPWATVDYSQHSHVVFCVRDATGQLVYTHPKYAPER